MVPIGIKRASSISKQELEERDAAAVAYSRNRLNSGDTLVIANYPQGVQAIDDTGFVLDSKHTVHSRNIFETGSKVLCALFDNLTQQKIRYRHKLVTLPNGIKYVIDLTPGNEDLAAFGRSLDTSCPEGFRLWALVAAKSGVANNVVGGKDIRDGSKNLLAEFVAHSVTTDNVTTDGSVDSGSFVAADGQVRDPPIKETPETAFRNQIKLALANTPQECAIRTCSCIERLLQIIEGKDPRLDSAPKIWTLVMLAEYFDCTSVVAKSVCGWVSNGNNQVILEILPEASFKLGMIIKSNFMVRTSFSIMVSEEALFKAKPGRSRSDHGVLGRPSEVPALDDNWKSMVQNAAASFQARIAKEVCRFQEMEWFNHCPELAKVKGLKDKMTAQWETRSTESNKMLARDCRKADRLIVALVEGLAFYVRGRLFAELLNPLHEAQVSSANFSRRLEQYDRFSQEDFNLTYDELSTEERLFIRYFWENLHALKWDSGSESNLVCDHVVNEQLFYKSDQEPAGKESIKPMNMSQLSLLANDYNSFVLCYFNDDIDELSQHLSAAEISNDINTNLPKQPFNDTEINKVSGIENAKIFKFRMDTFLGELSKYMKILCNSMLYQDNNSRLSLTDTIICLSPTDYDNLPIWAGGKNESPPLPSAESGFLGPGSALFQGVTTNSTSVALSDASDLEGDSITVGSSDAIGGAHSNHLDRRIVATEANLGSEAFSNSNDEQLDPSSSKSSLFGESKMKTDANELEVDIMSDDFFNHDDGCYEDEDEDEDYSGDEKED